MYVSPNQTYWYRLKLKKKKTICVTTGGELGQGGGKYGYSKCKLIYKAGKARYISKDCYQLNINKLRNPRPL